jgi:hypothetical protein
MDINLNVKAIIPSGQSSLSGLFLFLFIVIAVAVSICVIVVCYYEARENNLKKAYAHIKGKHNLPSKVMIESET